MIIVFGPFSMQIDIAMCTKAKNHMLICSGLNEPSLRRRRALVGPSLKLLLPVNIMVSRWSCN
jgi:hypothetical protein